MTTKTYRLNFDLTVEIDPDRIDPNKPGMEDMQLDEPLLTHTRTFVETFAENDGEVLEFYKRYISDLFGGDNKEINRAIAEKLPARNEDDSYLVVASTCPAETKAFVTPLIATTEEEYRAMRWDIQHAFTETRDKFHFAVLNCFRPPQIVNANLREMTGRGNNK